LDYKPLTAVWEITMGCNMRCRHCGSACAAPLPDELTHDEALDLVSQIAGLGLDWITLSGGEPFTRNDWDSIAWELSQKGVVPNIISNGWLIDQTHMDKARDAGVGTIALSLDGLEDHHDFMRKKGSFARVVKALELMSKNGVSSGVVTTLSKVNIVQLPQMRQLLTDLGVHYWQVQIGLPMGTFLKNPEMIMEPHQVDDVLDFAYQSMKQGGIRIYLADCLGYYNLQELLIRQMAHKTDQIPVWQGCNAGKRGFGILHNGEILGCTSIRDRQFIEGSIRERSLADIWNDPRSFSWNRDAKKADLKGDCQVCKYGDLCLGGCPNTRLTMNQDIHSENEYCTYNRAMKGIRDKIRQMPDTGSLFNQAVQYSRNARFQQAQILLDEILKTEPAHTEALSLSGYVHFFLNNYPQCKSANERILEKDPDDVYACKGLGLAFHKMGETGKGIGLLKKAVELAPPDYMDPYHDLAAVYLEVGEKQKALGIIEKGSRLSASFKRQAKSLIEAAARV